MQVHFSHAQECNKQAMQTTVNTECTSHTQLF